jgi:non-ribosomal peptide synthetase-like protein
VAAYAVVAALLSAVPLAGVLAGAALLLVADRPEDHGDLWSLLPWLPASTLVGLLVIAVVVWSVVRVAGHGVVAGVHPVRSRPALAVWTTIRVLDEARTWLFPLYSSMLTPVWLRLLGARIGREVEASTVLMVPSLTQVNDQAFLADDTLLGGYELGGGWLRVERVKIGRRAFVGNSGMAAPGRKVPKASLVAVLSAAPRRKTARSGESWLGSPPSALRRATETGDAARTYSPRTRLKVARGCVELCRLLPATLGVALGVVAALTLLAVLDRAGLLLALLFAGPVLALAGLLAAGSAAAAKWLLVGRLRAGAHPLWSSFVWRNELADTFVEMVAAPWFARPAAGTPLLSAWFRLMGARVGRGVWCETYWLPEADLVSLGDGATVNQGSVLQTHLFHDRMLSMDSVVLERGATLGPNSVILPAATLGRHATVGPVSLVMRGESVPARTTWIGNPIGPWAEHG